MSSNVDYEFQLLVRQHKDLCKLEKEQVLQRAFDGEPVAVEIYLAEFDEQIRVDIPPFFPEWLEVFMSMARDRCLHQLLVDGMISTTMLLNLIDVMAYYALQGDFFQVYALGKILCQCDSSLYYLSFVIYSDALSTWKRCVPNTSHLHRKFARQLDHLIPGAEFVQATRSRKKPYYLIKVGACVRPVLLRFRVFDNSALKQLNKHMQACKADTGYAVAPKTSVRLPNSIEFIALEITRSEMRNDLQAFCRSMRLESWRERG